MFYGMLSLFMSTAQIVVGKAVVKGLDASNGNSHGNSSEGGGKASATAGGGPALDGSEPALLRRKSTFPMAEEGWGTSTSLSRESLSVTEGSRRPSGLWPLSCALRGS